MDAFVPPEPNPWNTQARFSGIDFLGTDEAVLCTWGLTRSENCGSDHVDERGRDVAAAELSSDGRRVTLRVPDFVVTWYYSVEWLTRNAAGAAVRGLLHGTMH